MFLIIEISKLFFKENIMKIVLIIVAVVVLLFIGLVIYSRLKFKNLPNVAPHKDILILNEKNFNQRLRGKLVLVDFWAEWCGPCKVMSPILNDIAAGNNGGFLVAKVDVDKNQALAKKHNVRSIPTLVAFKNGKEVGRYVGIKTKSFLLKEMKGL